MASKKKCEDLTSCCNKIQSLSKPFYNLAFNDVCINEFEVEKIFQNRYGITIILPSSVNIKELSSFKDNLKQQSAVMMYVLRTFIGVREHEHEKRCRTYNNKAIKIIKTGDKKPQDNNNRFIDGEIEIEPVYEFRLDHVERKMAVWKVVDGGIIAHENREPFYERTPMPPPSNGHNMNGGSTNNISTELLNEALTNFIKPPLSGVSRGVDIFDIMSRMIYHMNFCDKLDKTEKDNLINHLRFIYRPTVLTSFISLLYFGKNNDHSLPCIKKFINNWCTCNQNCENTAICISKDKLYGLDTYTKIITKLANRQEILHNDFIKVGGGRYFSTDQNNDSVDLISRISEMKDIAKSDKDTLKLIEIREENVLDIIKCNIAHYSENKSLTDESNNDESNNDDFRDIVDIICGLFSFNETSAHLYVTKSFIEKFIDSYNDKSDEYKGFLLGGSDKKIEDILQSYNALYEKYPTGHVMGLLERLQKTGYVNALLEAAELNPAE